MKHKNAQSIGEAIREFLAENKLDRRIDETNVIKAWTSVLGNAIAQYTSSIFIKNGVLYVQLSSAVLRHELQMSREKIRQRLNEYAGKEIIKEIIFR